MKKIYMSLTGLLIAGTLCAQPILNEENNAPVIGDSFSTSLVSWDGTAPATGADQVWDYSAITAEGSASTNYYIPSECAAYADFPEADMTSTSDDSNYAFTETSTDGIMNYGYFASSVVMYYSNPEQQMAYPFAYGDAFTDDFHCTFESGTTWERGGSTTVSAEGYGTLMLPDGTIDDVLLVKMEQDYGDSTMGTEVYHYYATIYQFFREGVHHPVLSFTEFTIEGSPTSYSGQYMADPTLTASFEERFSVSVYPNPTQNFVFVQCDQPSTVESISIRSITGQKMYHNTAFIDQIDVAAWENGVYFMEITTAEGKLTKKLIKS